MELVDQGTVIAKRYIEIIKKQVEKTEKQVEKVVVNWVDRYHTNILLGTDCCVDVLCGITEDN